MIGNSRPEWVLIQVSVLIFRFTPLLYILALVALSAHSFLRHSASAHHTAQAILIALLVAEALFFVFLYRPHLHRAATTVAAYPKALTKAERKALFQRCVAHAHDPAVYLRGWFLHAELEEIQRDNVREFFLWAFFETCEEDVAASLSKEAQATLREELDEYIDLLEDRIGFRFAEGRGQVRSLRLTLEPVRTAYRSLAWYGIMMLVDAATYVLLRAHGFRFYGRSSRAEVRATFPPRPQELFSKYKSPASGLGYWYYGPTTHQQQNNMRVRTRSAAKQDAQMPVVFFHGIGVGLLTYLHFFFDLLKAANSKSTRDGAEQGDVRIMAVEMLPVSFRLTSPPLDKRAFLEAFTSIIDAHGWDDFAIVSHSYGSVPTTHILTADAALSRRAKAATLVDPVTIMLQLPHVAYNFTRRAPRTAAEWQLWYFASSDVGVATVLGRHFFWRQNIIWKDELLRLPGGGQRKVTVSLAAKDIIVNAPAVAQYLQEGPGTDVAEANEEGQVGVLWFPELDHAQVFDTPADYNKIIGCVLAEADED